MSQFRLARISLIVAALGLTASPLMMSSAHAQDKKAAPAADAKAETLRPDLFKIMDPAAISKLLTEKKFDEVKTKLAAAEAFPDKTPFETYILNRLQVQLGSQSGDDKMAMKALEASITSGRMPPEDQQAFTMALANYYYNAKDWAKSVEWMRRYQKESPTPEKVNSSLVRALYLSNDFTGARTELEKMLAAAEKDGKTMPKEDLHLLASAYAKQKDMEGYTRIMEKLVAVYPTDEFWVSLLKRMQNKPTFSNRLQLDVYRLQSVAVKALEPEEYVEMAELALLAGFPTEAKKALDTGYNEKVLGTGSNAAKHKQLRDRAIKGAADDEKNIATGEASAEKSKDGNGLINLGYAYFTMDQTDKGIALMEKGIARGGMKRPEEAKLKLGAAYAKAGRKADAIKIFESLKGNDGLSDLSKYWILWVNRPETAAAAAPAAK
jgi:hypothetical protein